MEEKSELNDIILNKAGGKNTGNKKVLLAIATLAIVLIIVVVIMNRINSEGTQNLPQAILPPEVSDTPELLEDDPLFEPITVIDESSPESEDLDKIAQRLKKESLGEDASPVVKKETVEEEVVVIEPVEQKPEIVKPEVVKPKTVKPAVKPVQKAPVAAAPSKAVEKGRYYIQVGSFARYAPDKKFIKSITDNGFSYTYHKVIRSGKTLNKVLIGPFESREAARKAVPVIRKKIEPGAFLTKV